MLFEADKVMFEIYRETEYTNKFKVVYFTELQDHNKESEINRALAGEHFFDGFIKNTGKEEAKEIIGGFAIFDLKSKEEAIAGAQKFMELHRIHWPEWKGETEVRQIFGPEDFQQPCKSYEKN